MDKLERAEREMARLGKVFNDAFNELGAFDKKWGFDCAGARLRPAAEIRVKQRALLAKRRNEASEALHNAGQKVKRLQTLRPAYLARQN